jgi:hypothetical protein
MLASCHGNGKDLYIGSLANLAENTLIHKIDRFPIYSFCHEMLVMTKMYASTDHFLTVVNIINDSKANWSARTNLILKGGLCWRGASNKKY